MSDHQKANIIRLVCSADPDDNQLALLLAQSIGWDLEEEYALAEWKKIDSGISLKKLLSDLVIRGSGDGIEKLLLFQRLFRQNPENWQYLRKISIEAADFIPEILELEGLESLIVSPAKPEHLPIWVANIAQIAQLKRLKHLELVVQNFDSATHDLAHLPLNIRQLAKVSVLHLQMYNDVNILPPNSKLPFLPLSAYSLLPPLPQIEKIPQIEALNLIYKAMTQMPLELWLARIGAI